MRKSIFLAAVIILFLFILADSFYALGQMPEKGIPEEEVVLSEEDIIKDTLAELIDVYYDEDIDRFLSYFSEDDYPDITTLEENMETTFEGNDDLVLSLTYLSTVIEGDEAIVRVDWTKNWDDSSTGSGNNNTIRMKKIDGLWKITDLEDSTMFIIGVGTVSGSVTDK